MNKLLILALFFACVVFITDCSEDLEETNIADLNADIATIREARDTDIKKRRSRKFKKKKNGKKRGKVRKGKENRKAKKGKKSRKAKKTRKTKKSKKGKISKNGKNRRKAKTARKSEKGKKSKSRKNKRKNKAVKKARKTKKNRQRRKSKNAKKTNKARKVKRKLKGKKRKNEKGRKRNNGKGRKIKGSQRATRCMNETCINTAMSYMKIMKDKVSNFLRQKTRIGKYKTTSGNKAGKKGLFGPILNRIREAGGGNSSNLRCNGDNSGAGAKQLKNLTSLLGACEENINTSCNANLPVINTTEHDLCHTAMTAFANLTKDCQMKTGEEACTCWTNSTLEFSANAVKKCDISDDNKNMTAAKKQCTTAFGKCRKIEDSVSLALSACSPANTKSRATADIKQGLKNKAAVTKATAKINATASNSTSRAAQGIHSITCAVFITDIKSATAEILRAPLLAGTETVLLALVGVTVATCSSEDKTTLFTLSVEMDRTAETIDLNIESKQNDLLISQGATVSTTVIQATIAAEAAATTAASAVNMNTKITTKAPSLKREMFKAANLLMNW